MSVPEIVIAENLTDLSTRAAQRFVEIVSQRQSETGTARISLSGGSTPRALFNLLSSEKFATQINWLAVDVFWGDERTVPPDHTDSNYRMAQETLLSHVPTPDDHVHRMRGELDPDEAANDYEQVLKSVFGRADVKHPPKFDLLLLGIGADGHTASLFPGTTALDVRDRLVVANFVPQQNTTRLSFTAPLLQAARNILFLVAGEDKAPAVRRAIEGEWNPSETPSQYLREATGHVIWMLDGAAASQLSAASRG